MTSLIFQRRKSYQTTNVKLQTTNTKGPNTVKLDYNDNG